MRQTVLPFKLEITGDEITPHAGLALGGEFMHALDLSNVFDSELPSPGSGAGYIPSTYAVPIILMMQGGGRSIADLRKVKFDSGLRDLLEITDIPSSDALGKWLRRMGGNGDLQGLGRVNRSILHKSLEREKRSAYTLDIDATGVKAEKQSAKWTYKLFKGYFPIVGHLAENGFVIGDEFREGNVAPAARNFEFIKYCRKQMPCGKEIVALRSDSAAYQSSIFNYCEEEGLEFAIGGVMDSATRSTVESIEESAWRDYRDGQIAETVHSMEETENAFRLIVIRRPVQGEFFEDEEVDETHRYTVIASNRKGETAEETLAWYNRRGETSENRIKELKLGFGMDRMPSGQFEANAVWFRLGVIAYNIFKFFKQVALPDSWRPFQAQTLRWRLYLTAGKIVHHAGRIFLKVKRHLYGLFKDIRLRLWEFAQA